jgi:hypothetical protein
MKSIVQRAALAAGLLISSAALAAGASKTSKTPVTDPPAGPVVVQEEVPMAQSSGPSVPPAISPPRLCVTPLGLCQIGPGAANVGCWCNASTGPVTGRSR